MTDLQDAFVLQGLTDYPEAQAAVREFRRLLSARIGGRIRARSWSAWIPGEKEIKPTRSERWGEWVGASASGRVEATGDAADIDVGMSWNSPDLPVPRAFYVYVHSGPDWLTRGVVVAQGQRVRSQKGYLFLRDDSSTPDIDQIFDELLAAFDAGVAVAARTRESQGD